MIDPEVPEDSRSPLLPAADDLTGVGAVTNESVSMAGWPRSVWLVAGAVVLLAVATLSRSAGTEQAEPPGQVAITEVEPAAAGADETIWPETLLDTDTDTDTDGGGEEAEDSVELRPLADLPPLDDALPAELTGTVVVAGSDGTVVTIDWDARTIDEMLLPETRRGRPVTYLHRETDGSLALQVGNYAVSVRNGRAVLRGTVQKMATGDQGPVFVFDDGTVRFDRFDANGSSPATFSDIGADVEIHGAFDGRLLVSKAGSVWMIDNEGGADVVSQGEVLGFDGRHLVMHRCDRPDRCRIEVGPPDDPARGTVSIPRPLADRSVASWVAVVSDDGQRLAILDQIGLSFPLWIDLDSGADPFNVDVSAQESAMAWSPDGRFLVYTAGDGLLLWDTETRRASRVRLGRKVDQLDWAEADGETAGDQP